MRVFNLLPLALVMLFLSGCQTTQQTTVQVNPHFLDLSFAGYENVPVESESEIFELNNDARRFVSDLQHKRDRSGKIEELVAAIFNRHDLCTGQRSRVRGYLPGNRNSRVLDS